MHCVRCTNVHSVWMLLEAIKFVNFFKITFKHVITSVAKLIVSHSVLVLCFFWKIKSAFWTHTSPHCVILRNLLIMSWKNPRPLRVCHYNWQYMDLWYCQRSPTSTIHFTTLMKNDLTANQYLVDNSLLSKLLHFEPLQFSTVDILDSRQMQSEYKCGQALPSSGRLCKTSFSDTPGRKKCGTKVFVPSRGTNRGAPPVFVTISFHSVGARF